MNIFTNAKISPAGKVNEQDIKKWMHNLIVFFAPLAVIYLLQLSSSLQHGALTFTSLIPTAITQGAIELYVVNAILDFLRKLMDANK